MKKVIFIYLLMGLLFAFKVNNLYSTVLKELTLKDLCMKSSHVVRVQTKSIQSDYNEKTNRIYTTIELTVVESIKGDLIAGESISIKLYGGTHNGITTMVIGNPGFSIDTESILFLTKKVSQKTKKDYFSVCGMAQGKYSISNDSEKNENQVTRDFINFPLLTETGGSHLSFTDTQGMSYSEFKNAIMKYLN